MENVSGVDTGALVFISSPVDTALMIQYANQFGISEPMFSSTWAESQELLSKGGTAIEGLEILSVYNFSNTSPNFQRYLERFEERYNRIPGFTAAYAYESILVLAEALKQTDGKAEGLREALTNIKNLEGVQGDISIDQYGDTSRDIYIAIVRDRQFIMRATISPGE